MRLLFIINEGAGNNTTDWPAVIAEYFKTSDHVIELYHLPSRIDAHQIDQKIVAFSPQRVIAVGGDGTIKLVSECLMEKPIPLGILPAGSANGLAKELGISNDVVEALNVIVHGVVKEIHLIRINNEYCIHLSDIGLNAYAMKNFQKLSGRGMWGYLKASIHALQRQPMMEVEMTIKKQMTKINAIMIVVANATKYGTGAVINPIGTLEDDMFEVIAVKKVSIREIFKMIFFHTPFNPDKTEIFQTNALSIRSRKKVHFQIDGEYMGLVNEVKASLLPGAIKIIMPEYVPKNS